MRRRMLLRRTPQRKRSSSMPSNRQKPSWPKEAMHGSRQGSTIPGDRAPWRIWSVSIDRKRLLEERAKAKAAVSSPELSDETRALYKKAMDHADVALGLDDAIKRKEAREQDESANGPGRD